MQWTRWTHWAQENIDKSKNKKGTETAFQSKIFVYLPWSGFGVVAHVAGQVVILKDASVRRILIRVKLRGS